VLVVLGVLLCLLYWRTGSLLPCIALHALNNGISFVVTTDVPVGGATLRPGPTPVAGVAWAQHKGVAAVEVRVDRGPWHEARLAAVPDIDTWRQWVWEWPATPGDHVIEARATDKTGYTQTAVQAQPVPNGASGYPSAAVTVRSS